MKRGPLQDVTNTSHWLPVQGIFEQENPPDCSRAHDAPRRKTKNSKKRAAEEDLADLIDTRRKNSSAPTGTLSKSSFSSPVKFSGLDLEKPSKLTAREFGEKIDWAIKFPFSWKDGDIVDWSNVRLSVTVTLSGIILFVGSFTATSFRLTHSHFVRKVQTSGQPARFHRTLQSIA